MLLAYNGLGLSCCSRLRITSCQQDSVASDVSTEDKKHMQIVRATKEKNEEKEKEIEDEIEQKKNKKKKGKQKQQKKVVKQEEEKTLGPINISNQA